VGHLTPNPYAAWPAPKRVYPQHKVRTSATDRTLDSMFPKVNPSQIQDVVPGPMSAKGREVKESICRLASVSKLRAQVTKETHGCGCVFYSSSHRPDKIPVLSEIIENHTFVGIADLRRCLSLIQHSTKLYLVDHGTLS
jgi:DNA mismatch repair protein MLH1